VPLGVEVGLGPGDVVLDGDPAPLLQGAHPSVFGPCLLWPRSPVSATAELMLILIKVDRRSTAITDQFENLLLRTAAILKIEKSRYLGNDLIGDREI